VPTLLLAANSSVVRKAILEFHPHVEGMRALAILLVVAAHAGVPGMAGGIIGVDVFFVISGYLISALLTIEAVHAERIDFKGFYARRLRRLLPALLLVLTATGLMAALLMPRSTHPEISLAGASATLWLANLYFAFVRLDYFGIDAGGNPFLHMWSLGVEEQFYLVWPVLIAWMAVRAEGTRQIVLRLRWVLAGALVLSLAAFLWLSATPYALQAYYLMPLRVWQFALGGLVWLACSRSKESCGSVRHPAMFALAGYVAIIVATYTPDAHAGLPEWRALSASIGAALLLAAGISAGPPLLMRLLTALPMLAIGRVSYAWYLWHWPVLVLGQIYFVDADLGIRILLAMVAWALAVLTQRFVETPLRNRQSLLARPGRFILASLLAMAIVTTAFLRWHENAQVWLAAEVEKNRYLAFRWDVPRIYAYGCDDWFHSADLKICRFGTVDGKKTAVIMGDSVGLHWFPALEALFTEQGWTLLVITKSSCPMVDEPVFYPRIKRYFTECAEWREKAVKAIAALRPDMVLLGSSFGYGFDAAQWKAGTRRLLERLSPATQQLYVIRATPVLPFDGLECLAARAAGSPSMPADCVSEWDDRTNEQVWGWIGVAAHGFDNVKLLDLNDLVCPDRRCSAERDGRVVYRDKQHITASFSASLAEAVGERISLQPQVP
jgi:peptidoglycan/LPS O-acetylase OafA/YrhL